jgi:hypothetical protein
MTIIYCSHTGKVCENWIRIRLTSIETIELVNFVPCDDHNHPLVLLVLKQPEIVHLRGAGASAQTLMLVAR